MYVIPHRVPLDEVRVDLAVTHYPLKGELLGLSLSRGSQELIPHLTILTVLFGDQCSVQPS